MTALARFSVEIAADPRTAPHARALIAALRDLDLQGDGIPAAAGMFEAAMHIIGSPAPLLTRLCGVYQLAELVSREPIVITIPGKKLHPNHQRN
jgi:hypothetical protein